uniref:Rad60/SUMO-like domain-containing protein n=1 Tax=Alexandrium andersonii TaxID=327968 RepID=A0A7S2GXR3_9DINO
MKLVALLCGAAVAQAHSTLELEDASQLFQSATILHEGPAETKPTSFMKDVAESMKPSQTFKDALMEIKNKWKQHKAHQLETYEPWRAKEQRKVRELKAKHHGNREKPLPPSKQPKPLSEEERQQLEKEARLAKFGEPMTLIVREPEGREFIVKFRTNTRLQVLMHSMCKKLDIELPDAVFMHRDRKLEPLATATSFGLVDQDVIEVDSPALQAEREKKARQAAAVAMAAEKREQAESDAKEKEDQLLQARLAHKLRTQQKNSIIQNEQRRKQEHKVKGMVTLIFEQAGRNQGPPVHISVKATNWLQGTMDIVSKRMSLDPEKTRFFATRGDKKVLIRPHDSAHTLKLKDEEMITVTHQM